MKFFKIDFSISTVFAASLMVDSFKVISEIDNKISGISNGEDRFGTLFHPENINETFPILDNFINLCKVKI